MAGMNQAWRSGMIGAGIVWRLTVRFGTSFAHGLAGLANQRTRALEYAASRDTCDLRCVSELFAQALHEDSNLELDWLWYAAQLDRADERSYCLERALQINPRNRQARQQLSRGL